MGTIYMFTNKVNGKKYIGKSHVDVIKRHNAHINGHGSKLLKRAFDKYGVDGFDFTILHDGIFDLFLSDYEIKAIKKYNTKVPNGYNLTDGGDGMTNPSDETRQKLSEAQTGRKHSVETRRKMSVRAKSVSDETRQKLSEAQTGKKASLQTRLKLSESHKGQVPWNKGKSPSEETRQKISDSLKGNRPSKETRRKLSELRKGKPLYKLRHPYHQCASDFYFNLPDSMSLPEKRKLMRKKFSNKVKSGTLRHWLRVWANQSELGKNP